MRGLLIAAAAVLAAAQTPSPAPPLPSTCSGSPNTYPISSFDNGVLVNQTANGIRYLAQPANYTPGLTVLHVYGTAYEMGLAYGQLMAQEIQMLVPEVMLYIEAQVNASLGNLPEPFRSWVDKYGLDIAFDLTEAATKPYAPGHFYDTMQGLADGSGVEYKKIYKMAMIPELVKAQCSIIGAWGPATDKTTGTELLQLRALDWDTDGPFQKVPLLLTYHPNAGDGQAFTVMTWAGLVGAVTGWGSSGMGISEKVWLEYKGVENILGYPFHWLMQDILQYDVDMDAALSRIATANRTCSVWLGIGDKANNVFKAVQYSNQEVNFYNPNTFPTWPNHDRFTDLIFVDKHVQPSQNPCMNDLMHAFYGHLNAEATTRYVTALAQTGDMHIAVYDYQNSEMYVSNAGVADASGNCVPAYDRPFLKFNMDAVWNTPKPAL